ncbi:MAG: hypothetical protein DRH44_04750 [Candidatus Coatesbacteria bacterium]|nr:MAG: hypothetical protein DRH44_04750 [Candidatus Coatesbacteria bacterium]
MTYQYKTILILSLISVALTYSMESEILHQGNVKHQYHITILGNGSEGPYSLPINVASPLNLEVYVGGKYLSSGSYDIIDEGRSIMFHYPVSSGVRIEIYFDLFEMGEVMEGRAVIEGGTFDISGSKNFSVSVAGDGDATIDQATRLRFKGSVGELDVEGRLTDEELPITAEGASEEVADIDQVLVKVDGYGASLEMGDIEVASGDNEFVVYRRRLLGITGKQKAGDFFGGGTLAVARGEHSDVEFKGQDGIQGPYIISVPSAYGITIIPSSERVYLNGELMKRGESNDYIIDYYEPSITFTRNRLITSQSRIYVEFDYSELAYRKKFYAGETGVELGGSTLKIGFETALEEDDPSRDLIALSGDDRKRLYMAGDDETRAFRVATDENGDPVYEYAGEGEGDYRRQWNPLLGKYVYEYVGEGRGDYKQVTYYLPMPQRRFVVGVNTGIDSGDRLNIDIGLATSNSDLNLISPLNDDDNVGSALIFNVVTRTIKSENTSLKLSGGGYIRDSRFLSIDEIDSAYNVVRWEIEEEETRPVVHEYSLNAELKSPIIKKASFEYGRMSRLFGDEESYYKDIRCNLYNADINIATDRFGSHLVGARFLDKNIRLNISDDEITDGEVRQRRRYIDITSRNSKHISILEPYLIFNYSERFLDRYYDTTLDKGSISSGYGPGLILRPSKFFLDVGYQRLGEREVRGGDFFTSYNGHLGTINGNLGMRSFALNFGGSIRRIDYLEPGRADVYQDVGTISMKARPFSENILVSAKYKMTSEREYEREEVFIIAEDRNGDYRREEDPNNPGRYIYVYDPEDKDAIYIRLLRPTGEFYPISGAEGLLSFSYERHGGERQSPVALSGYISVSERSRDPSRFKVFTFLRRMTNKTVEGSLRRSLSFTLFPSNNVFSPRLGYDDTKTLDRVIVEMERRKWSRTLTLDCYSAPISFFSVNYGGSYTRFSEENSSEGMGLVRRKNGWETTVRATPRLNITGGHTINCGFAKTIRFERNDNLGGKFYVVDISPGALIAPYPDGSITIDYNVEWVRAVGHTGTMYIFTHPEGVSHKLLCSYRHQMPKYINLTLSYILDADAGERVDHEVRFDVGAYF